MSEDLLHKSIHIRDGEYVADAIQPNAGGIGDCFDQFSAVFNRNDRVGRSMHNQRRGIELIHRPYAVFKADIFRPIRLPGYVNFVGALLTAR